MSKPIQTIGVIKETRPDEKACLTTEIEVPQVEKVMISFKIPYVNYIGKSPDLTTFSASETSISAVRQVFSSGFVSKLFFKPYSHRLSTLEGRGTSHIRNLQGTKDHPPPPTNPTITTLI